MSGNHLRLAAQQYGVAILMLLTLGCGYAQSDAMTANNASVSDAIERLQFRRVPQVSINDPEFAALVFRYADSKEMVSLQKLRELGDAKFAEEKYSAALHYYMRLVAYGEKGLQLRIGLIHLQGLGDVEQDVPRGMAWLELARESPIGDAKVNQEIESIWQQLDQTQRRQAQAWLDKLATMYSNDALLRDLDNYYDHYFFRPKTAQD